MASIHICMATIHIWMASIHIWMAFFHMLLVGALLLAHTLPLFPTIALNSSGDVMLIGVALISGGDVMSIPQLVVVF